MANTKEMSEKEIWDDSALQNSWNEALEEYNHYHSIHARGEKVEDVLKEFEGADDVTNRNTENIADGITMDAHVDGVEAEVVEEEKSEDNVPVTHSVEASNIASTGEQENNDESKSSLPPGMPLPGHLIGAVHDEDLKRLLMSWYFSGYYTGLYEGKRAGRETNPTG